MDNPLDCNLSCSQSQSFREILEGFSEESEETFSNEYAELNKMENIQSSQPNADPNFESLINNISQIFPEGGPLQPKDRNGACLVDQEKNYAGFQSSDQYLPKKRKFSKEELTSEIKRFEGLLDQVGLFCKNTGRLYKETRIATIKMIREKFTELRFLMNAKEGQFIHEINSLYHQMVEKLHGQVGSNSLVKKGITRKTEYWQIMQGGQPSELLEEEDLSAVYQIIQEAVGTESMNKINQKLQEMKQNVDSMLNTQLSALEKMSVMNEELTLLRREVDLKLDEKLPWKEELKKANVPLKNLALQALAVSSKKADITTQGGWLQISYPFDGHFDQNMKAIQAAQENILALGFTLSKNIEKICQEDLLQLSLMRFKLPRVRKIFIELGDFQVSDDSLFDIFSCLFWKNNSLDQLNCNFPMGLFEKSALFLTDNVLSAAENMKNLNLWFGRSRMTNNAHSSLNQRLSQLVGNLTHLYFRYFYSDLNLNLIGLSDLFVKMPNLKYFCLSPYSYKLDDETLEDFISSTMPSLQNLKSFQLWLPLSKVTDRGIRKLFKSFPEEWFLNLTELRINLEETKITDKCLKDFGDETLRKFKALEDFRLHTTASFEMKKKIAEWEKVLSKESTN